MGRSLHEWSWLRNANHGRLCLWPPASVADGKLNYLQLQHFQIRPRYCWRTHQCFKTCHWTSWCLEQQLGLIFRQSCCHRKVRQQHSAPYEFYRTHLNDLPRFIHCSFGERFNILSIPQREGGIIQYAVFWKDESWSSVQLYLPIFSFPFFCLSCLVFYSVYLL